MSAGKHRVCPICEKSFTQGDGDSSFPFCSERCRLLDLGNWLGEGYAVPGEPVFPPTGDDSDMPS